MNTKHRWKLSWIAWAWPRQELMEHRKMTGKLSRAFSGPSGITNSLKAKILAIKGLYLFKERILGDLLVEADSVNAIKWIQGGSQ